IANITYRGVPLQLQYSTDVNGNEAVTLKSDALKINKTFDGYDPLEDLKDYLIMVNEDGREILTEINRAAVRETGFDPVAGNPNSLMATMVGTIHGLTNTSITGTNQQDIDNQWDLGIRYGSQTVGDMDVTTLHLPI